MQLGLKQRAGRVGTSTCSCDPPAKVDCFPPNPTRGGRPWSQALMQTSAGKRRQAQTSADKRSRAQTSALK
eukprot:9307979-Alexandrium_andersonii.AAC.1